MSYRVTASIGALLLLSACAVPNTGGQQAAGAGTPGLGPQQAYSQQLFRSDMATAGVDLGSAESFNDPNRVTSVVKHCYDGAQFPQFSTYQSTLRRCLVMDYVAYRDDLDATHHGQLPGNPFFEGDVVLRRWAADAPRAGFSSPDEMFQFMRAGYAYAKPSELSALRTHNQQIFVQPQPGRGPSILPGSQ